MKYIDEILKCLSSLNFIEWNDNSEFIYSFLNNLIEEDLLFDNSKNSSKMKYFLKQTIINDGKFLNKENFFPQPSFIYHTIISKIYNHFNLKDEQIIMEFVNFLFIKLPVKNLIEFNKMIENLPENYNYLNKSFSFYDLLRKQLRNLKNFIKIDSINFSISQYYEAIYFTTANLFNVAVEPNIFIILMDFHIFQLFAYEKDKIFNNKIFEKVLCRLESFEIDDLNEQNELIYNCLSYFNYCFKVLKDFEWFIKKRNRFFNLIFIFYDELAEDVLSLLENFVQMEFIMEMEDDDDSENFLKNLLSFKECFDDDEYFIHYKTACYASYSILSRLRIKFISYQESTEISKKSDISFRKFSSIKRIKLIIFYLFLHLFFIFKFFFQKPLNLSKK